jgi:phosphoribosylamine---glycine ligase
LSTILVVGNGGREHALAWRLSQDPGVTRVLVAPGNAGTARTAGVENVAVAASDIAGLIALVRRENVRFTVVGPEIPLSLGIVDQFQAQNLPIFGPRQNAAELETSKAFTKDFLARHAIPTARYAVFTERAPALAYIAHHGAPIVVKADGLAAGKGVVVATSVAQANAAVEEMLGGKFSDAATQSGQANQARVVIEEFLVGEEASYIVIAANASFVPMATSQDHKRAYDGDMGPNTGGMGAYSPAPVVTPAIEARIQREIIAPTLAGMLLENRPFTGFLYAGVMIDSAGNPKVLEFNTRMGDPETQAILVRLVAPLLPVLEAASAGTLAGHSLQWRNEVAVGVVLCAAGYPEAVEKGLLISGLPAAARSANSFVFHAGTKANGAEVLTDGGRVLCAVALGADTRSAQANAYACADQISWTGRFMRRDIGWRALG